ncbi:MAG: hypothetical protein AB1733_12360 [Thermodesulfobacteriota bacterium]
MVDETKRRFFGCLFRKALRDAAGAFREGCREADRKAELNEFFGSYESSYALTLCYPDDILLETARMEGIDCAGKDKIDIVKQLLIRKGGVPL